VVKAAQQLAAEGIETEVFSVTSWSELARDGLACEQRAGGEAAGTPFVRASWPARPHRRRHRLRARRAESIRAFLPAKAAATSRWAPTGSAAATRARRCGRSSGWMRRASL
jgi:pyruvate dehydrogenase complex dehydrogenase (E1) component